MTRAEAVRAMFTRIAGRYDLMNSVMTGGRHHAWRRITARAVAGAPAGLALDLATGTGDLALAVRAAAPGRIVVGADFSEAMLRHARIKLAARGERGVALLAADALSLPFGDKTFTCVTSAFLLRNLVDLSAGLAEMRRVTMPGGLVAALEITRPGVRGWDAIFGVYFNRVVPLIGAAVPAPVGRALRHPAPARPADDAGRPARRELPAARPRHDRPPRRCCLTRCATGTVISCGLPNPRHGRRLRWNRS
jgi:demethylmenaquinone methyltransferase/2-methoxy-6-polyprenyl-1,4-benzoquinol methylase